MVNRKSRKTKLRNKGGLVLSTDRPSFEKIKRDILNIHPTDKMLRSIINIIETDSNIFSLDDINAMLQGHGSNITKHEIAQQTSFLSQSLKEINQMSEQMSEQIQSVNNTLIYNSLESKHIKIIEKTIKGLNKLLIKWHRKNPTIKFSKSKHAIMFLRIQKINLARLKEMMDEIDYEILTLNLNSFRHEDYTKQQQQILGSKKKTKKRKRKSYKLKRRLHN